MVFYMNSSQYHQLPVLFYHICKKLSKFKNYIWRYGTGTTVVRFQNIDRTTQVSDQETN